MKETDWWKETKTDCYIDPQILLLLVIPRSAMFKTPLSTYASQPDVLNRRPAVGDCLSRNALRNYKLELTQNSYWLKLPQALIWHLHIPFHHAHEFRANTWLLLLIFTGASCLENLWLRARSRVNMQHTLPLKWLHSSTRLKLRCLLLSLLLVVAGVKVLSSSLGYEFHHPWSFWLPSRQRLWKHQLCSL